MTTIYGGSCVTGVVSHMCHTLSHPVTKNSLSPFSFTDYGRTRSKSYKKCDRLCHTLSHSVTGYNAQKRQKWHIAPIYGGCDRCDVTLEQQNFKTCYSGIFAYMGKC